jgi:hypothetical protein
MSNFASTINPTPFSVFDSDIKFQSEADQIVVFVKRKLGDDVLSVELTKKQIWSCFEEATLEYSSIINEHQAKNTLYDLLGMSTSSLDGAQNLFARKSLDFFLREAEPYAAEAGIGGSYNTLSGSVDLESGRQDYDIYEELKDEQGNLIVNSQSSGLKSKLKIFEVFHFSPQSAYRFFDTSSSINYLNNQFSFESFTPETVFYVLPVFEDILRGGQLSLSNRVRRSNYSFRVAGTKIRIYPTPTKENPGKLWFRVGFKQDPFNPDYQDDTIGGVNNINNAPFGVIQYSSMNSIGHQWVRQFTLALCKELLGLIRSKFSTVPIPDGDATLNGESLISQGREDQNRLRDKLRETLDSVTYNKMLENKALENDNLLKVLKSIPIPIGKAITIG